MVTLYYPGQSRYAHVLHHTETAYVAAVRHARESGYCYVYSEDGNLMYKVVLSSESGDTITTNEVRT